jgi:hypothetical protein|tara:strand:+ start:13564 stop:14487 length:924 start_codon:yes stop_codon:yes gene_type:complete
MPYIKVPEFKSNEVIDPDQFNDAFSPFTSMNLDGENFMDESLGPDQIPANISLTDSSNISVSVDSFSSKSIYMQTDFTFDPLQSTSSTYSGIRKRNVNYPALNFVTLTGLEVGEKFIIRVSCAVEIQDGGWRTYYHGIPPYFKIGLVQFPGESSTDLTEGSSSALTKPLHSTVAHYRVAFTGKVPSASSISEEASLGHDPNLKYRDQNYDSDYAYRDNRLGEDYDPRTNKSGMPFSGYHSYTTAYLHEQGLSDNSTQSFGVMCWFGGQSRGMESDGDSGGVDGCRSPSKDEPAIIRDFKIFVYQVKK